MGSIPPKMPKVPQFPGPGIIPAPRPWPKWREGPTEEHYREFVREMFNRRTDEQLADFFKNMSAHHAISISYWIDIWKDEYKKACDRRFLLRPAENPNKNLLRPVEAGNGNWTKECALRAVEEGSPPQDLPMLKQG